VLFDDWTPRNTEPHEENLEIYSNCEAVELFLNGKSLGSKARRQDDAPRNWSVAYEPGTLKAVGKNKDQMIATRELRTAGKPARIVLTSEHSRIVPVWDAVLYVNATVADENGVRVPSASDLITFKIAGPGVIAAVDNANNASHESFQAGERNAYQGVCFAIVRGNATSGKITLTASASGLTDGSLTIQVVAP
jgi:beta-galactosidase